MLKVAFFEDDENFAQEITEYFAEEKIEILHFKDGSYADVLNWHDFGCVIIDLEMPSVDGRAVLKNLPQDNCPFILIVSSHSDLSTRLALLEAGADFFISKPIDVEELATLARKNISKLCSSSDAPWHLDSKKLSLAPPYGKSIILTMTERNIMERLLLSPNVVIPKNEIFSLISPMTTAFDESGVKRVEVALSRLRLKFRKNGHVLPIKSVRHVGYVFLENAEVNR